MLKMNLFFLFYFLSTSLVIYGEKLQLNTCCELGEIVVDNACEQYSGTLDYSKLIIYDENFYPSNKSIEQDFNLNFTSLLKHLPLINLPALNVPPSFLREYLTLNGILFHEQLNTYDRFQKIDIFCIGHYLVDNVTTVGFWVTETQEEDDSQNYRLTIPAMFLSSFFFVLVLIVYSILPELRNLHGMILMGYVGSTLTAFLVFATFLFLSNVESQSLSENECYIWTCVSYYLFLASFSWMTIMSFDIWWTFRGYAKTRPIHRRGELFKFIIYCLYAFGLPLLMTLALYLINEADLTHIPWFVQPKLLVYGCFLGAQGRIFYLYVPMLMMFFVNWVLFLLTAFNIWRLNRATAVLYKVGNRAHRSQRHRFGLYLKLSAVMGINWVLEVVSLINSKSFIWKITDAYNLLSGLLIFIIFICKRKIYVMLKKRFSRGENSYSVNWRSQRSTRSTTTTTTTIDSVNDSTIIVSHNPEGF